MGCFSAPAAPVGPPNEWASQDVKKWLKSSGLKAHQAALSKHDGQALLALEPQQLATLLKLKTVPAPFTKALDQLRTKHGLPLVVKSVAAPLDTSTTSTPEPVMVAAPRGSVSASLEGVLPFLDNEMYIVQEEEELAESGEEKAARSNVALASISVPGEGGMQPAGMVLLQQMHEFEELSEAALVPDVPSAAHELPSALMHVGAPPQGVSKWAEVLAPFADDSTTEQTQLFLERLGKGVGGGRAEAALQEPAYGQLFGSVYRLDALASQAGVGRDNCAKAAGLGADTLRILDAGWRRAHGVTSSQGGAAPTSGQASNSTLESVSEAFTAMSAVVLPYTAPGWLVEVCCDERNKEKFDATHNVVVDALKAEGLNALPGGRPLSRGDYHDLTRVVRRSVRSHGSGDVTKGLLALKAAGVESDALNDLAALLGLDGTQECTGAQMLMVELDSLPTEAGLDVEVYYNSLVLGVNGGAAHRAVFQWYDKKSTGIIDHRTFALVLSDLGLLEGKTEAESAAYIKASLSAADTHGMGHLTCEPFCAYYATLTTSRARQQLRACMGLAAEDELRATFTAFASFGSRAELPDMDSGRWAKLARECGLVTGGLVACDIDLIFARVKRGRRINFDQFVLALGMCADKKGVTLESEVRAVLSAGGPVTHSVRPETVRLHDDKSTYTGVYAKGGPRAADGPSRNDLSSLVDRRNEADVRGVKKAAPAKPSPAAKSSALASSRKPPQSSPPPEAFMRSSMGHGTLSPAMLSGGVTKSVRRVTTGSQGSADPTDLHSMFTCFATFGQHAASAGGAPPAAPAARVEMDSSRFLKLCRECKLIDATGGKSTFNAARADLIFAKVKAQGHSKITFEEFTRALDLVATERGMPAEDMRSLVMNADGPLLTRLVHA